MSSVPEASTPASKLPINIGDWIDPAGVVEVVHHRWYFCKAVEIAAPDMLDDLFTLDALVDEVIKSPSSESTYDEQLMPALMAWCSRWHIQATWLLKSATNTLAWRHVARQHSTDPLNRIFLPNPFGPQIAPEFMTRILEESNPGWSDTTYQFVVPEFAFSWHPTQHTKSESRAEAHRFIDKFLDTVFADAEEQLREGGYRPASKGQAGTVKMDHFIWAVHHYLLRRNFSDLAREFRGQDAQCTSPGRLHLKQVLLLRSE